MDKAQMSKAEVVSILKNASQMLTRSWDVNPLDEKDERWKIFEALATFIKEETKQEPKPNDPNFTMGLSWDGVVQLLKEIDYLLISPTVVKIITRRIYYVACRLSEDDAMGAMARLILCYSVESPVWEFARVYPWTILFEGCSGDGKSKAEVSVSVEQMISLLSMDRLRTIDAYKLAEKAAKWCIGQSTEDVVRVLDCIYWHEIPFFEFPDLVIRLVAIFPEISQVYPKLLAEFASVMTVFGSNADVASLLLKPTRHGGIWRQYNGVMESGGDGIDVDKRPGIICLDPNPGRIYIDENLSASQWWDVTGMNIVIQSGDEMEVHTVNGTPDFILTAVGDHPRCERLEDDCGFSRYLVTTTFTGTYHVRVGPRIHSFEGVDA